MQDCDPKTRRAPRALAALIGAVMLTSALGTALAGPRDFRAKIDSVDTSDAPEIRLFATFLDDRDQPVNPRLVDLSEIRIDGDQIDPDDIEMEIWLDQDDGTDLVFVLPAVQSISEGAIKVIKDALPEMVGPLGEEDRAALITYSRAVTEVVPLSTNRREAALSYKGEQKGVRPFMYSSIDKAISMLETSAEGRKRAIIFVGDGTDAGAISIDETNKKLGETITRARRANVKIWTVGFSSNGMSETSLRSLALISHKTGATARVATSQRDLQDDLQGTLGEIIGQLVFRISRDFEENRTYEFQLKLQSELSEEVVTETFKAPIGDVRFDWIFWGIFCGITCIVVGITTLIIFISVVVARRKQARKEAEELLAELLEDRPEKCETCFRSQKPEWEECPFCAQGMDPLTRSQRAVPFVYDDDDNKLCNTCGRVCMAEWAACSFCAQGMEPLPEWLAIKKEEAMLTGNVDPEELAADAMKQAEDQAAAQQAAAAAAAAEVAERQSELAQGGRECPTCARIMKSDWPECLFCASGLPPLNS
jgi:hypothetical protein